MSLSYKIFTKPYATVDMVDSLKHKYDLEITNDPLKDGFIMIRALPEVRNALLDYDVPWLLLITKE